MRRLDRHRFIGTRDTMRVYDCDDSEHAAELEERMARDGLLEANLIQTFGPDTLAEARNRGFRPA